MTIALERKLRDKRTIQPYINHQPNMSVVQNNNATDLCGMLGHQQKIVAKFELNFDGFSLSVDLELPSTGVTVFFGPSGSGKTTCLRAMAGLEKLDCGYFSVGKNRWQDSADSFFIPTHQRDIGYVFQEAGLFPHLSVLQNLEYGQKRVSREKQHLELSDVCELLGISHLLERSPQHLSGGEKQRVAIARALLTSPKILLMDEPLSALDNALKADILPYLEALHREFSIPIVYVTHSVEELIRLADHIVLFEQGKIIASNSASCILSNPDYHALFGAPIGSLFDTQIAMQYEDHLTQLDTKEGISFLVPRCSGSFGDSVRCQILASDVSISCSNPREQSILNNLQATIVDIKDTNLNGETLLVLELKQGVRLLSVVTQRSLKALGLMKGTVIWAQFKAAAVSK